MFGVLNRYFFDRVIIIVYYVLVCFENYLFYVGFIVSDVSWYFVK